MKPDDKILRTAVESVFQAGKINDLYPIWSDMSSSV